MRRWLSVVAISMVVAPCAATPFLCNADPAASSFIAFAPTMPNASQVVSITAGYEQVGPDSVVAVLSAGTINVTLTGNPFALLPPPMECLTTSIGPLPVGTYSVNLFAQDATHPATPPVLVATSSLTVAGEGAIPTTSGVGIVSLALLLSLAGWLALRRR